MGRRQFLATLLAGAAGAVVSSKLVASAEDFEVEYGTYTNIRFVRFDEAGQTFVAYVHHDAIEDLINLPPGELVSADVYADERWASHRGELGRINVRFQPLPQLEKPWPQRPRGAQWKREMRPYPFQSA